MLKIDGSMLEGGGQLVRSAVALSALSGTPVDISSIRAGRERPGLAAQHVAAIRAVALLCQAECTGLSVGSRELTFRPGPIASADISVDVGTAGSIPLVLQAWLPVALHAGGSIHVTGGTEVPRSPTIDYLEHLLAGALRAHGARIELEIDRRGYYPQGGGAVSVVVNKAAVSRIGMAAAENGQGICSCSSNLPDHVAARQAEAAIQALSGTTGKQVPLHLDRRSGPSTGSSITIWSGWKG
ncbi:MAG: RNA 3'-phosphate cyclase, partial [Methanoregulaceae archaeon]|nr:RNA 3'-phosphate cyclase [Methanoregulaceae archaeon]